MTTDSQPLEDQRPLRLALLSTLPLCRAAFGRLFEGRADTVLCCSVDTEGGLAAELDRARPDLVVYLPPPVDGREAERLHRLTDAIGSVPIVLVQPAVERRTLETAFGAGARGIVSFAHSVEDLVSALRFVAAGGRYVPTDILQSHERRGEPRMPAAWSAAAAAPPDAASIDTLTARQRDVLAMLWEGLSNREIGERLAIAEGTVKVHVARIIEKLGARNRVDAARYANLLFQGEDDDR